MDKYQTYIAANVMVSDVYISHYSETTLQAWVEVNLKLRPGINIEREIVTWKEIDSLDEAIKACKADMIRQLASYGVELFDDHTVNVSSIKNDFTITTWKELDND